MHSIGNSLCSRKDVVSLGGNAECWLGLYQSLIPSQNVYMNLDVSATAFYEPSSLVEACAKVLSRTAQDFRFGINDADRIRFEKFIRGVKIVITHRGKMRKKYRVINVTRTSARNTLFKINENDISVADYFRKQYGMELQYADLPCIEVGTVKSIYFPLEVCEIVEGQRHIRKLNETQTAKMIRITCQTPSKRAEIIETGVKKHYYNPLGESNDVVGRYDPKLRKDSRCVQFVIGQGYGCYTGSHTTSA